MSIIKGMHFGMKEGDKFLRLDLKVIFSMAQSMFPLENFTGANRKSLQFLFR